VSLIGDRSGLPDDRNTKGVGVATDPAGDGEDNQARTASGAPVLIAAEGMPVALDRIDLASGAHSEAWLQQLVFDQPRLLPITQIEPGLGSLTPVATEVACGHGYIDNVYLTGSGDLVIVEVKLWRNPQARREVVAQALDYVAALTGMGFEAFEAACRKGKGMAATSLHGLVAEQADALDEAAFIDAVSRNLARGRIVVLVLGDGIRSETLSLAALLQSHVAGPGRRGDHRCAGNPCADAHDQPRRSHDRRWSRLGDRTDRSRSSRQFDQ